MTKDEAIRIALTALENVPIEYDFHGNPMDAEFGKQLDAAITALRQALAEPKPVKLTDYFKKPYAYVDAVDSARVYVAPERKLWLKEKDDKEWRAFHAKHEYDIPLYTEDYNYEQQDC